MQTMSMGGRKCQIDSLAGGKMSSQTDYRFWTNRLVPTKHKQQQASNNDLQKRIVPKVGVGRLP